MKKLRGMMITILVIVFIVTLAMGLAACAGSCSGTDGVNGVDGVNGADGADGLSAYELYKQTYGYDGTETEWLYDLANGNLAEKKTHTVTFDYNDGSTESTTVTVEHGYNVPQPEDPEFTDYAFEGWYCGDEKWSFIGYVVTGDITLTAKWTSLATDGLIYDSYWDGYAVIGYEGTETDVYIPSVYNGNTVLAIQYEAFFSNNTITSVTIPASVTSIGELAFALTTSLETVHFIKGSRLESIGNDTFSYSSIKTITIPANLTSIGYRTFEYATSLETVYFEEGSKLTTIGEYAFFGSAITSIQIPANVTTIESRVFCNCSSLTGVTFEENSKLTTICEGAFRECSSLTSIQIPVNVTTIKENAFRDCSSLTSVTFEENSKLTSISSCAFMATGITSITLPDSLQSLAGFYGCTSLSSVTFSKNSQLTTIEEAAFAYSSIMKIVIPAGVTTIGWNAFLSTSLLSICYLGTSEQYADITINDITESFTNASVYYYSESRPSIDKTTGKYDGNYWYYLTADDFCVWEGQNFKLAESGDYYILCGYEGDTESKYYLTATVNGLPVKAIGERAFQGCIYLNEIVIGSNITSILNSAFYNCPNLTKVYYCGSVVEWAQISFGSGSACPMYNGAGLYVNCTVTVKSSTDYVLTAYDLAEEVNIDSALAINSSAFYGCTSLTTVTIGTIGYDADMKTIEKTLTGVGEYAFRNCVNLTTVILSDSVTSIGKTAFDGCTSLTTVYYMGGAAQFSAITIGDNNSAFTAATVYYYSETQPSTSGNYWHYVLKYYEYDDTFTKYLKVEVWE